MLSYSPGRVHKDEHGHSPKEGQDATKQKPIWEDLNTKLNMLSVQADREA